MNHTRYITSLILLGLLFGATPARAAGLEYDINRPGHDIGHVPNVSSPGACAERCRKDNRCVAFTWVRPGCQAKQPICWLKKSAPPTIRDNCAVSGLVNRGGNSGHVTEGLSTPTPQPDNRSGNKTDRGCACIAPDGRRYRHAWGQDGCPAPDSANADYRSCR